VPDARLHQGLAIAVTRMSVSAEIPHCALRLVLDLRLGNALARIEFQRASKLHERSSLFRCEPN
jgi:hypothetical protein